MNLIKEKSTAYWLTDAQREVYEKLTKRWQAARFVNVHGPAGCGKSFVARILVKEHGYVYTHDLQSVPPDTPNVVVEDAEYTRLMRPTAQLLRLGRVILLSRRPTSDPMPRAGIQLTETDVNQFLHNLYQYCDITFHASEPQGTDLDQIIRAEIVARGGNHVT
jgi:ABC-type cobalamin/Fe3+-siderophores transport system ATPase subunit